MRTLAAALLLTAASATTSALDACGSLTQALDGLTRPGGYLGAVAWVVRAGQPVVAVTSGQRDLARQQPMTADTLFRIYSMSKPIASAAAMLLVEDGRLALDTPIERWLPEFAGVQVWAGGTLEAPQLRAPARPITVRHLMSHQGGFAVGSGAPAAARTLLNRAAPSDAQDLAGYARRVARAPLAADPGTRFAYDGVSTEVLGRIIEIASGLPFDRFLKERVFAPLAMRDTTFEVPDTQRPRVVDLTAMGPAGQLQRADTPSAQQPGVSLNPYPSGAGGLYSTAADFARFCQVLTDDGKPLLKRESVAAMFENQLASHQPPTMPGRPDEGFGLGGAVGLQQATFGWTGAAATYFSVDASSHSCAILLLQHLHHDGPSDLPKVWPWLRPMLFNAAQAATPEAVCRR